MESVKGIEVYLVYLVCSVVWSVCLFGHLVCLVYFD